MKICFMCSGVCNQNQSKLYVKFVYLLKIYCNRIPNTNCNCIIEWQSGFWSTGTTSFMYIGIKKCNIPIAIPPKQRLANRIQ